MIVFALEVKKQVHPASTPDERVPVTEDLAAELEELATALGHPGFRAWVGTENYEMRVASDGLPRAWLLRPEHAPPPRPPQPLHLLALFRDDLGLGCHLGLGGGHIGHGASGSGGRGCGNARPTAAHGRRRVCFDRGDEAVVPASPSGTPG